MSLKLKRKYFIWITASILVIATSTILTIHHLENSTEEALSNYLQENNPQEFEPLFILATNDDSQAVFNLAMMYWDGVGLPQNHLKGKEGLIKSANAGNKNALYNLGMFRFKGLIADNPDDPFGYRSIEKAADLGNSRAQVFIGSLYLNDDKNIFLKNINKARHYITLAAKQNEPLGLYTYAGILDYYDNKSQEAVDILTALVSDDFLLPAFLLESIYEEGRSDVDKNPQLAKKYAKIVNGLMSDATEETFNPHPRPLTLFSTLPMTEQSAAIVQLETLATLGNSAAIYQLFDIYSTGDSVNIDKTKAIDYLSPLINKKDPKALYLRYITMNKNPDDLISAANNDYTPAIYYLYQAYSFKKEDKNFEYSSELAERYLNHAARLGDMDAMLAVMIDALENSDYPTPELNEITTHYATQLLKDYPNNEKALFFSSYVYANEQSELYDPQKAFELNKQAFDITPEGYIRLELANKYAYGLGTKQDLKKAVYLYNENIVMQVNEIPTKRDFVDLFYADDISSYANEKTIVNYILDDIKTRHYYLQAYYYADYLLRTDAEKNSEQAFDLYNAHSNYNLKAKIHYAIALVNYKKNQETQAIELISDVLNDKRYKQVLSSKELNATYELLMNYSLTSSTAKKLLLTLAVNKSYSKAEEYALPLVDKDANITFQYAIDKLKAIKNIDKVSDEELKSYYDLIFKAADLGSRDASLYIAQNLTDYNYFNQWPYFSQRFIQITGLTQNDTVDWFEKCANQGDDECWYQLGKIFEKGRYKNALNYPRALSYYQNIKVKDYKYVQSSIDDISKVLEDFTEYKLRADNDDDYANLVVADAYKNGKFGQLIDESQWLKYLDRSAMLGNKIALQDIIRYYSQDKLKEQNRQKLLNYYIKSVDTGDEYDAYKLALHYFEGSFLVQADRNKAKEYFVKSGQYGEKKLNQMETFDTNYRHRNSLSSASFDVGRAYLYGNGIPRDVIKAKEYFLQAAEKGHSNAILEYANLLTSGKMNLNTQELQIKSNWDEAIVWLQKIPDTKFAKYRLEFYQTSVIPAQQGDADAILRIANWYYQQHNFIEARDWHRKSLELGNYSAIQSIISLMPMEENEKQQILQVGVEHNDKYSMYTLANMIIEDPSITSDSTQYQLAIRLLDQLLTSKDKFYQDKAYYRLTDLYQGEIKTRDGIVRERKPSALLNMLELQSDSRVDALYALYSYYSDQNFDKALTYLVKAYPKEPLRVTNLRYQAYYPTKDCTNKNANVAKSAYYLKQYKVLYNSPENINTFDANYYGLKSQEIGAIYFMGSCGISQNIDKAIEWYQISLENAPHLARHNIYDAYVAKGDAKQAYLYALILNKDTENNALFDRLSLKDKQDIEERYQQTVENK